MALKINLQTYMECLSSSSEFSNHRTRELAFFEVAAANHMNSKESPRQLSTTIVLKLIQPSTASSGHSLGTKAPKLLQTCLNLRCTLQRVGHNSFQVRRNCPEGEDRSPSILHTWKNAFLKAHSTALTNLSSENPQNPKQVTLPPSEVTATPMISKSWGSL